MEQAGLRAQIDTILCDLLDAQSLERILSAWRIGQIDELEARELLTNLGLLSQADLAHIFDE